MKINYPTQAEIKEFMEENGIVDLMVHLRELRAFESYVQENYNGIFDEAWASIVNEEEN